MGTGPAVGKHSDASKASTCVPGTGMGAGGRVSKSRGGALDEFEEDKPKETNPFADFAGPPKKSGGAAPVLQASFPEMEARKKPAKKAEPDEVFADDAEDAGDPLLSSGASDDWAASDSFREKRRSLTRRHQQSQQKKSKNLFHQGSGTPSADASEQAFLDGEGEDEWRPSDSQQMAPMRELQGLGAHDEDQFEDEEEDGLGTRMLAREADDMERDSVDEEFFSDIDVSLEDYTEAVQKETVDNTVRVVRKLDDTQFLDYDELEKIAIAADAEISEGGDAPLPTPAPSREGTVAAVPLSEADFGRALRQIPARRLSRLVDPVIEQEVLSCEQISRQEFETLFGSDF